MAESGPPSTPESGQSGEQSGGAGSTRACKQVRFLPIANIGRITWRAVPGNGKIAKDAMECASKFISFNTNESGDDKCQKEKRKTINGDDLLCAIATLAGLRGLH